jgi:hypothetical protein
MTFGTAMALCMRKGQFSSSMDRYPRGSVFPSAKPLRIASHPNAMKHERGRARKPKKVGASFGSIVSRKIPFPSMACNLILVSPRPIR